MSIRRIGIVPGSGADRHTRREAFYSSSSFVRYDTQKPHTTIPGYKDQSQLDDLMCDRGPVAKPAPTLTSEAILDMVHWWTVVDNGKKEYFIPL
eukprot:1411913-Pyramimonas_sp.AAC.1